MDYIVDDRVFLLGLDELYRGAVRPHEETELLAAAAEVAKILRVGPASVPVEGYYTESEALSRYFRLMRALQAEPAKRAPAVTGLQSFQRLRAVTSSAIYGRPNDLQALLPTTRDPLGEALARSIPDWTVPRLVQVAQAVALEWDDYSLSGLAARAGEPVVLAALRESVVLEVGLSIFSREVPASYLWKVSPALTDAGRRFVTAFNALFDESLPDPGPEHARRYWNATEQAEILGRCGCLGRDPGGSRYYHWAVRHEDGKLAVHAFWDGRLWTTDQYRAALHRGEGLPV